MKILDSYFENCSVIIIDIETTGLFPERNRIAVGGVLYQEEGNHVVRQFFSENRDGEQSLLLNYVPFLEAADVIISFNGDSFDIPFINRRLAKNGIPYQIPRAKSFDLYRIIRQSGFSGILPDLKQTTVERYLGIAGSRKDNITGRESVELYDEYLRTGDDRLKDTILLHNRDDLLQLNRLIAILKNVDLHRIMYSNGFNVIESARSKKISVNPIRFSQNAIEVTGNHSGINSDYIEYAGPYTVNLMMENQSIRIRIPLRHDHGLYYIDLKDFDFDTTEFAKYPNCRSDYLIVASDNEKNHAEINHLIKRICKEILSAF